MNRGIRWRGSLVLVCALLALPAWAAPDGKVIWELVPDRDFRGEIQRAAIVPDGRTVVATSAALYEVREGKARLVAQRPEENARLLLAPGGRLLAWMTPRAGWHGLFSVQLQDVSGERLGQLQMKERPFGFGALYLGYQGKLIATVSPLDDWQGLGGRFEIAFWDRAGRRLGGTTLEGRHTGVLDAGGEAIVFLGPSEAVCFASDGRELWRLAGEFRKAALARAGRLALLNPSSLREINRVVVHAGGSPSSVTLPTPVHGFALSPDGSAASVIGDRGRYFSLDVATRELREEPRLPIDGAFYIFNASYLDARTLALGVLQRVGEPPKESWPRGTIVVVDRGGRSLFQRDVAVRRATSNSPGIATEFGTGFVIGFSDDTAMLIEIAR